jgi:hypothetical protein
MALFGLFLQKYELVAISGQELLQGQEYKDE